MAETAALPQQNACPATPRPSPLEYRDRKGGNGQAQAAAWPKEAPLGKWLGKRMGACPSTTPACLTGLG